MVVLLPWPACVQSVRLQQPLALLTETEDRGINYRAIIGNSNENAPAQREQEEAVLKCGCPMFYPVKSWGSIYPHAGPMAIESMSPTRLGSVLLVLSSI
jgi:hypothetical protein